MANMYVGAVQPAGFPLIHLIVESGQPARAIVPSIQPRIAYPMHHVGERAALLSRLMMQGAADKDANFVEALDAVNAKIKVMRDVLGT